MNLGWHYNLDYFTYRGRPEDVLVIAVMFDKNMYIINE
jgi:hypothetical protein